VFVKGRSDKVELPEKVDVITSEILGHFGYDEHVVRFKMDARKRFLRPEGRLVPAWLELYLVPVTSEGTWNDLIGLWSSDCYGLDFSAVRDSAASQMYATDCSAKVMPLAPPPRISHISFYEIEKVPFLFRGEFIIQKKGPLHAMVGYFRCGLSPSVILSTSPDRPKTHWMQTFFPMQDVIMLEEGDEMLCTIKAIPLLNKMFWEWDTRIIRGELEIAAFNQSDLRITKEVMVVGNPSFRRVLTRKGEISRRVLHLCDGKKSIGEISELIRAEYPETYESLEDAVQEVVGTIRKVVKIE
jgi:protein arginine N-methyltransferase 1